MRELVEFVSVALARSVASALLWNTDHRRPCLLARRGGLGSPGEVHAAVPVGGCLGLTALVPPTGPFLTGPGLAGANNDDPVIRGYPC